MKRVTDSSSLRNTTLRVSWSSFGRKRISIEIRIFAILPGTKKAMVITISAK